MSNPRPICIQEKSVFYLIVSQLQTRSSPELHNRAQPVIRKAEKDHPGRDAAGRISFLSVRDITINDTLKEVNLLFYTVICIICSNKIFLGYDTGDVTRFADFGDFNRNQDAMHQRLARFYYFRKREYNQPHQQGIQRDEVRDQLCLVTGKSDTVRFDSNVRWSTSFIKRITRYRTSQYYCWVSSRASRHRSNLETLKYLFF
jgi:hypothetical protein